MDKKDLEGKMFGLISYMIVSARNLLEEPALYGPFRLVDAASRLITILGEVGISSDRLRTLQDQIEAGKYSAMGTEDEFKSFLESTVYTVVDTIDTGGS